MGSFGGAVIIGGLFCHRGSCGRGCFEGALFGGALMSGALMGAYHGIGVDGTNRLRGMLSLKYTLVFSVAYLTGLVASVVQTSLVHTGPTW